MSYESKPRDNIPTRGQYGTSLLGLGSFVGLRALDIFIQHAVLSNASTILSKINVSTFPSSTKPIAFGLPLKPLVLLGMATGSAIKQIFTVLFITNEVYPVKTSVGVSVFNTLLNTANSLVAFSFLSAQSWSLIVSRNEDSFDTPAVIGLALYAVGIVTETVSEVQRKVFKNKPENKGKVYSGGLFGLARHINYGAYTIWRAGYATVAGGPGFGGEYLGEE